ncbi:MAG: RNA polymerase sigma factor [Pirellulales bacterium]|nr:RNA polymerase sigma factor [Pirellulales bacterium]
MSLTVDNWFEPGWPASLWQDTLRNWIMTSSAAIVPEPSAKVSTEDHQDVAASLGGDGEAFARLVDRYQNDVGRLMWRFTRDRVEWETLVQDVMVEAYVSLANYRQRGAFGGWLRTIATRVGYRFWKQRDRRREREAMNLAEWDAVAENDEVAVADTADLVHRTLAQMKPRDRLVLTLIYLEQCSIAECAERTGWSQAMVKVQAHRARGRLRKLLEKETDS